MKKHKKQPRRFVQRMKAKQLPGIVMDIPDELKSPIRTRQPDSVARLVCPVCGAVRYFNQVLLDHLEEAKRVALEAIPVENTEARAMLRVGPRHTPCKAMFRILPLEDAEEAEKNEGERKPTTDRLAEALSLVGASQAMIDKALQGLYDDFKSELPMPTMRLVTDARAEGLHDIARRAMEGEFEAEPWESDEWARSPDGQATFKELLGGKDKP